MGSILFVAGTILEEISYVTDIWMLRVIGSILFPVGMVIAINASLALGQKKRKTEDGSKTGDGFA